MPSTTPPPVECPVEICSPALRSRVLSDSGNATATRRGSLSMGGKKGWFAARRGSVSRGKKARRYSELAADAGRPKRTASQSEEWLHPQHHIETGVEYEAGYIGSATIGPAVSTNTESQDAVLLVARQAYAEATTKPTSGTIDVSSTCVSVCDSTGLRQFSYALDHIPFASCDATDPTKIYFVTIAPNGVAMMHLFRAANRKEGLAFTFTVAQAFHVRWNVVATSPRRATSPTGAIDDVPPPLARRGSLRLGAQPACTLGHYSIAPVGSALASRSASDGGDGDDDVFADDAPASPTPAAASGYDTVIANSDVPDADDNTDL